MEKNWVGLGYWKGEGDERNLYYLNLNAISIRARVWGCIISWSICFGFYYFGFIQTFLFENNDFFR